jgi:AMP phosphorylase
MKLKLKILDWSAGLPVAMLSEKTAKKMGVRLRDRISIKVDSREITTIVDIAGKLIKEREIAISSEIKRLLRVRNKQIVDVNLSISPNSLEYIKRKLNNQRLSEKQINEIIKDVSSNSLSEAEIALFISANYKFGMSFKETIYLTKALLGTGSKLNLKDKIIADKHSIGGIAGRTTPLVVSICASAGLTIPKTSSRAITTPAGTADAMETLAKVDFNLKELKKILKKTRACIVWGGGLEIVPADSKIISIEKSLKIDPESQLLASIMSKKLAMGSNHIIIHMPYGKTAKIDKQQALRLRRKFSKIAKYFKIKLDCILTENNGPTGGGVGPVLEMIDVLRVLKRENPCYKLEEESLLISGKLLELTRKAKKGEGKKVALEILNSGKAFKKFKEIVKAQKGFIKRLKPAKFSKEVFSNKTGKIIEIDNKKINSMAILSGCPADKSAGLYLYLHFGDKLKKGEKILTIYSESKSRLKEAFNYYKSEKPISIQ